MTQSTKGHGRVEQRSVSLGAAEPLSTGFPSSRTFVRIRSERTQTKSGKTTTEDRTYPDFRYSSINERSKPIKQGLLPQRSSPQARRNWAGVIRGGGWLGNSKWSCAKIICWALSGWV